MAAIILREKLNFARISGMTFGVLGSLLILEPWYSDISYIQILPICAGFFYACNIIIIKRFCSEENPLALEVIRALVFILIGVFGIIFSEAVLSDSIKSELPFIAKGWLI